MSQTQSRDGKQSMLQSITLSIGSRLEDTVLVAMAVRGVCGMTSLSIEEVNRVELCVVEVVNNAIEHAYKGRENGVVEVDVVLDPVKSLEIIVSDRGRAMDTPLSPQQSMSVPDPDDPDTWLSSGRGLPIVERLMDTIHYESSNGRNSFHMVRQLN